MTPLDLPTLSSSVQELQVVFGVCSCWGPHTTLTIGVGCVVVGTWPGVPIRPFGVSGTLHTSFGAVEDTPAGSPCGWNPNRRHTWTRDLCGWLGRGLHPRRLSLEVCRA